jgi:hypothetical protein
VITVADEAALPQVEGAQPKKRERAWVRAVLASAGLWPPWQPEAMRRLRSPQKKA